VNGETSPGPPDALAELRRLWAAREWSALVAFAGALPDGELEREPESGFLLADALRRLGRTEEALTRASDVALRAQRAGDSLLRWRALNVVGMSLFEVGRLDDAEATFTELLAAAMEDGDEASAARAANNLGVIANVRGARAAALTSYQRALAAYQRLGDARGLAQTHHNLAISYRDLGFDGEADAHGQRAIRLARRARSEDVRALAETERASLRVRAGDARLAERMARSALRRFEAIGDPLGAAAALGVRAAAAPPPARDEAALERLERALATARAHSDPLLLAEVQRDRGLLLRDLRHRDEARGALLDAAVHFERLGAEAEALALRAIAEAL
jgi:tetratricopeptide (TPR) repeat protein